MKYPRGIKPRPANIIQDIKKNKYKNIKVEYDGITFDSKKERDHYIYLKNLEMAGEIKDLRTQIRFELQPKYKINKKRVQAISYIADFIYLKNGNYIVEDTKGYRTQIYKIKKKMFEYKYKIEITEVWSLFFLLFIKVLLKERLLISSLF